MEGPPSHPEGQDSATKQGEVAKASNPSEATVGMPTQEELQNFTRRELVEFLEAKAAFRVPAKPYQSRQHLFEAALNFLKVAFCHISLAFFIFGLPLTLCRVPHPVRPSSQGRVLRLTKPENLLRRFVCPGTISPICSFLF